MTREEAINSITQFIENYACGSDLIGLNTAIETLKKERPHGTWIRHIDDLYPEESTEECSVCHAEQRITGNDDDFCPKCGADMRPKILDQAIDGEGKDGNVKEVGVPMISSNSEMVPDYRDGWRLKEGEENDRGTP